MNIPLPVDVPHIEVDSEVLRDGARTARDGVRRATDNYDDASSAWKRLRDSYHHEGTQEAVWHGLDLVDRPLDEWRQALVHAADCTDDFADAATVVQALAAVLRDRHGVLEAERLAALASEDTLRIMRVTMEVHAFNSDVDQLCSEWMQVQEEYASALRTIHGGENDELPGDWQDVGLTLDWGALQDSLDTGMRVDHPAWIAAETKQAAEEVRHLDATEFLNWVKQNPGRARTFLGSDEYITWLAERREVARDLVKNPFPARPAPGSPEERMAPFVHGPENMDPASNRGAVKAVRAEWDRLTPEEQAYLLFTYPIVFGNMNGVPMEQRAQIGAVNVRGNAEIVEEKIRTRAGQTTWEARIPDYSESDGNPWGTPRPRTCPSTAKKRTGNVPRTSGCLRVSSWSRIDMDLPMPGSSTSSAQRRTAMRGRCIARCMSIRPATARSSPCRGHSRTRLGTSICSYPARTPPWRVSAATTRRCRTWSAALGLTL
ncbi:hypothetical protein [Micrococcus lylae]|uniref:hypothetical protein n=1 Tax=Micrococcus lylae TaxID=1273 RepID=UPI000B35F9B5|nr:hypothetical protein [Micrococcus lylae]